MTTTRARMCTRTACSNPTRDPSGRCHHHRGPDGSGTAARALPSPTSAVAPSSVEEPDLGFGHEYDFDATAGSIRMIGGPSPEGFTRTGYDGEGAVVESGLVRRIVYRSDSDPKVWRIVASDGHSVIERWMRNGKLRHPRGGPSEVVYRSDGTISAEKWITDLRAKGPRYHRLDGPAEILYRTNESIASEQWYRNDQLSRIDGPASIRYAGDGSVGSFTYSVQGTTYGDAETFYALIAEDATDDALRGYFAGTPFAELAKDRERETVKLFRDGVRTLDGVAEVFGGAPLEWVRAYEESGKS